ncbi:intestinal mucin-like protein [Tachysurus ichikawai]
MAPKWQVNNKECPIPTTTTTKIPATTKKSDTTTTKPICQPDICKIIFSKAFEECHKVIDPENFYKACLFDVCNMNNATGCFSLEGYAQMCAEQSICVDWRNLTKGQCAHKCPNNKVYLPCGPKVEPTCNSGYNKKFINCESIVCRDHFREGCYCPNGTTLFDTTSDVCTDFCGCTGSDGQPKNPGDKWRSECNECTCSKNSMGPLCEPVKCPNPEVSCTKAGYMLQTVDCCPQCVCNPSLCRDMNINKCPVGFELVQNNTDSDCCITFYCKPKNVCVFGENVYLPGEKIPTGSCENCVCGSTVNSSSNLLNTECIQMQCNIPCPMGFTYKAVPGQCCGKCEQIQCVYEDRDQSQNITTAEVGQSWTHPSNPCVTFNCTKVNNAFVVVKMRPSCPEYNPEDCIPGTEEITSDGCCTTCQQHKCNLQKNSTYLKINDCISVNPVEIASCSGSCDTNSIYSMGANTMMHHCSCCKELQTSSKQVQLRCADNTLKPYTYTYVEECGCHITKCTD